MNSPVKRGIKKCLSLSLACVMLMLLLAPLMRTEAEAASSYRVKHWHETFDDGIRQDYYSVYKGDWDGVPTFFTDSTDVFTNRYTGQDVRITLYRSIEGSKKKAETFCKYLQEHSSYKHCYTSWYYNEVDNYREYFVFRIEGYNFNKSNLKLEKFLDRNPWVNSEGLTMEVYFIDQGNVISENWSLMWNDMGCSAGVVLYTSHFPKGLSFGLAFYDWDSGKGLVRRYCVNETW